MSGDLKHEKLIARNTLFLYGRILISILLSLYTSRVVLEMLGVKDYGIYNIVGGIIIILSFLNGTMSGATQRFLNYEMGCGKQGKLAETFSAAWVIHIIIATIVLIIGETVGVWLVNNYLVIAPERIIAANWTFQFSLLGGILTIIMVPFVGAIYAHEKLNIYAIFTLVFSFLKLCIALMLLYVARLDNLITFAALMTVVYLIHFLCFFIYALKKFPECTLRFRASSETIRSMLRYSGSDLIGTSCYTIETQGVLVVLNRIGGTVLNAAGGLTATVTLTINQFGSALIMAFRPQIIQQYAARNFEYMQRLLINCSKYAIILLTVFLVPAFIEMDYILNLWLTEVPQHTSEFCRITLLASMSQMAVTSLACGIHATGKVFVFSFVTGFTYIIQLPIMYWLILWTSNPDWAYILSIFQLTANVFIIAYMLNKKIAQFSIFKFVTRGFLAPSLITLVSFIVGLIPAILMSGGFLRLTIVIVISFISTVLTSWTFLIDDEMKSEIKVKVHSIIH